jgi:malate dehydrogenase (quinone)
MYKMINMIVVTLSVVLNLNSVRAAQVEKIDVLLVGGGIMSATLGVWLSELEPHGSMEMMARLGSFGSLGEESPRMKYAGTCHSALAELSSTPMDESGNINISKPIEINEAPQITRQFLAWQVRRNVLTNAPSFISSYRATGRC